MFMDKTPILSRCQFFPICHIHLFTFCIPYAVIMFLMKLFSTQYYFSPPKQNLN